MTTPISWTNCIGDGPLWPVEKSEAAQIDTWEKESQPCPSALFGENEKGKKHKSSSVGSVCFFNDLSTEGERERANVEVSQARERGGKEENS